MANEPNGLSTVAQIEALADQLSAIADDIHVRVMKDINGHKGAPFTEAEQAIARGLLEDEVVLRQRANGLYADAATYVVQSLGQSQQKINQLTADAAEKIRKISRIADITGLVGGLLVLAGAAATGQPAPIVAAIERVSKQVKRVAASTPHKAV
ncbi:hypothetical protein [Massilia sp. TWP1-3-3]|uniref:hypothetical protein n=1 Tax=Massilia sp. TWP1-3-3 TaxID=2804573 RepID=UPI003CFBB9E2